ncbi:hypothetical protein [Aquisalinus flavus]|uniref:Uncharacterized protein n=1 Tax=Aquisalinus flavus TaxID=1526572 RepID=A0A8J2Y3B2_9PROT|nr:hypothetical protein [Aquisalinus flavus]MBD0427538.1 hypothetical protein [Aquisalinus flavus]UNE47331.1 hypothetical protein FF099_04280 [Aquisalinus flavus]GGD01751.1 hypothetical protein GCM10011342_08510 [Aquisalinus flavus]
MRLMLAALVAAGLTLNYHAIAATQDMQSAFNRVSECNGTTAGGVALGKIMAEDLRAMGKEDGVDAMEVNIASLENTKEIFDEGPDAFKAVIPNLDLPQGQEYFDTAYSKFMSLSDADYQTKVTFWVPNAAVDHDYCLPSFDILFEEYNRIVGGL